MRSNKRIYRILLSLTILTTAVHIVQAQGINFERTLNWNQVKAKAKLEHKYIFVDCYATWCGPCKLMDRDVYPTKKVGDIFNKEFISLKMQMDKTPKDNPEVQDLYGFASYIEKSYAINAYPSFLFFDSEGNPVHKAMGVKDIKDFLKLAEDARNTKKQYYSILKNYQPGKIDTSELKGLARSFKNQDEVIAGKLASEYLSRIPQTQLNIVDNRKLMVEFQANSTVLNIVVNFIRKFNKEQFEDQQNLILFKNFSKQSEIANLVIQYFSQLHENELKTPPNQYLLEIFHSDTRAQQIAQKYIRTLTEDQSYSMDLIGFLYVFTNKTSDQGFKLFCDLADKFNAIEGDKQYSSYVISEVIGKTAFTPLFAIAKETRANPDWSAFSTSLKKTYPSQYAERVILNSKLIWYKYGIDSLKEEKYWTQFNDCKLKQIEMSRFDTIKGGHRVINTIAYLYIFEHSTANEQIKAAIEWMKKIVTVLPDDLTKFKYNTDDVNNLDTYACLLYKAGNSTEALKYEQLLLEIYIDYKEASRANYTSKLIGKMQKGEKIWLDQAFLNNVI